MFLQWECCKFKNEWILKTNNPLKFFNILGVNLDTFYNKHILPQTRDHIIQSVKGKIIKYLDIRLFDFNF